MRFSVSTDDISQVSADVLGVVCFDDQPGDGTLPQAVAALNERLEGLIGRVTQEERFKGKKGQTISIHTHGRVGAQRVLLLGVGARKDFQASDLRGVAARLARASVACSAKVAALALPYLEAPVPERAAQFIAEGAALGLYKFDKYLGEERRAKPAPEELRVVVAVEQAEGSRGEALRRALQRGDQVAKGVALARDLVNEPAGEMTPSQLAEVARKAAKDHGLDVKILGPKECEKLGMGMFLAVSRGSDEEPRLIHLVYKPKGKAPPKGQKRIALVGKGVTFDSGGLSLKPSASMEDMKIDMSGAAAVISAIGVLAELGCPHEVHAIAACCENMPSGKAYKLGDVLRSMAGKTVEINNTDAEGRLTLGDAIAYALKEAKPDEVFDFATLTGACVVALGPHIAGVMGNDLSLVERWMQSARLAGEEMWHLPLPERMKDQLKSEIADMRNTGERWGGALTAGIFLKEFVGETPWVHVDLAGPASADKESGHVVKGGTGFAVSTIVEHLVPRE